MKNKTLYRTIEKATYSLDMACLSSDPISSISKSFQKRVEEARKAEINEVKKSLIERFANDYQGIAEVIDGDATFYSYGQPIIENISRVEDNCRNELFGYVLKDILTGKDSRCPGDVNEAFQYLTEQQIIDPGEFFSFRLIHPATGIVSKIDEKNPILSLRTLALTGLVTAPIGARLGYQIGGELGAIPGGLVGLVLPMLSGCGICSLGEGAAGISKQRESFEKALRSLDSDVRKYFPLNENRGNE